MVENFPPQISETFSLTRSKGLIFAAFD